MPEPSAAARALAVALRRDLMGPAFVRPEVQDHVFRWEDKLARALDAAAATGTIPPLEDLPR